MLDRDVEKGRDLQRELEARIIVAALEIADRLRVDVDCVSQRAARGAALAPKERNSVVNFHQTIG